MTPSRRITPLVLWLIAFAFIVVAWVGSEIRYSRVWFQTDHQIYILETVFGEVQFRITSNLYPWEGERIGVYTESTEGMELNHETRDWSVGGFGFGWCRPDTVYTSITHTLTLAASYWHAMVVLVAVRIRSHICGGQKSRPAVEPVQP